MVQLQIVSGKLAGSDVAVRQFPFVVGRGQADQLQITDEGVWESHFRIDYDPREGFSASRSGAATLFLNGETIDSAKLRNGDIIGAGAAQIRFWLAPTRQKTMRFRETVTWLALGLLFAFQLAVIYRLLQ